MILEQKLSTEGDVASPTSTAPPPPPPAAAEYLAVSEDTGVGELLASCG